jgi:hypothetical protein
MEAKNPIEKAAELEREVDRGRSERTPFLALTGVSLTIAVVAAVVIAIAFLAYWLA